MLTSSIHLADVACWCMILYVFFKLYPVKPTEALLRLRQPTSRTSEGSADWMCRDVPRRCGTCVFPWYGCILLHIITLRHDPLMILMLQCSYFLHVLGLYFCWVCTKFMGTKVGCPSLCQAVLLRSAGLEFVATSCARQG